MSKLGMAILVYLMWTSLQTALAQDTSDLSRKPEKLANGVEIIPNEYVLTFDPVHPDHDLDFVISSLRGNNLKEELLKTQTTNYLNVIFPYFKIKPADLKSLSKARLVIDLDSPALTGAKKDIRFKRIERNYRITNPYGKEIQLLQKISSTQEIIDWGVKSVVTTIHQNITSKKKIYVLDSGVDKDHEDLNVDKDASLSFIPDVTYYQVSGYKDYHGTHVAGIIGAKNNGKGIIGVAPNASIVAYKVIQEGSIPENQFYLDALDSVLNRSHPGDVLNISIENTAGTRTEVETIQNIGLKGVVVVMAAGNSSENVIDSSVSPAKISGPNIYTVASSEQDLNFSDFSNYGQPPVKYVAPGRTIYSTLPGNTYGILSGTSQSAPHVAGLFILESVISSSGTIRCLNDQKQYSLAHE